VTQISVKGLAQLRRDLKAIEKTLPNEIRDGLKDAAGVVSREATVQAPRLTGRLSASLRPGTSGARAFIRSPVPYGNVIHWGGTTGKGHSATRPGATRIRANPFIKRAADVKSPEALDRLADNLEKLALRHGFRR
jgi:hypothetical protein